MAPQNNNVRRGNYRINDTARPKAHKSPFLSEPSISSSFGEPSNQRQGNYRRQTQSTASRGNYRLSDQQDLAKRRFNQEQWMDMNTHPSSRINNRYRRSLYGSDTNTNRPLPEGRAQIYMTSFILLVMMFWMAWLVVPTHWVNQLIVVGNQATSTQKIIQDSNIRVTDTKNKVLAQKKAISDQIMRHNPMIESVDIKSNDWTQMEIDVKESHIVGRIKADTGDLLMLSNGLIVTPTPGDLMSNLPYLQDFDKKGITLLAGQLNQVHSDIISNMDTIYYSTNSNNPQTIEIKMKDTNIIKAQVGNFSEKINLYPKMVEQVRGQTGIYNIEVGAYFTPIKQNGQTVQLDTNILRNQ